uniref:Chitin-binding type-2 domain-containing protein n=1 Tax=Scylla olivacea TaxID=85551 RepID=A0A0P4VSD4_SCYOL
MFPPEAVFQHNQGLLLQDCAKYVTCSWGRGVVMTCAAGTLFNPESSRCDFSSAVTCYSPPPPPAPASRPQFIPPGQGIPPGHRRDPPGRGGSRGNSGAWGRNANVEGIVDITVGRGRPPKQGGSPPGQRISPPGQGGSHPGKGRGLITSLAGTVSVLYFF